MSNNMFNGALHIIGLALTLVGNRTKIDLDMKVMSEKEKNMGLGKYMKVDSWPLLARIHIYATFHKHSTFIFKENSFPKILSFLGVVTNYHPPQYIFMQPFI